MGFRWLTKVKPWLGGAILLCGMVQATCTLAETTTQAGSFQSISKTDTQNAKNNPNHGTLVHQAASAYENSFTPITSSKTTQDLVRNKNESDFSAVDSTKMAIRKLQVPKDIQAVSDEVNTNHKFSVALPPTALQQTNEALKITDGKGTEVPQSGIKPFVESSSRQSSNQTISVPNAPSDFIHNINIDTQRALKSGDTLEAKLENNRRNAPNGDNYSRNNLMFLDGSSASPSISMSVEDASHVQVKEVQHRNDFASAYRRRMMTEEEYASYFNWISDSEIEALHDKIISEQQGKNPETQLTENDKRTAKWSNLATDAIAARTQTQRSNTTNLSISKDPRQERNLSIVLGITNQPSNPQSLDERLYPDTLNQYGAADYSARTNLAKTNASNGTLAPNYSHVTSSLANARGGGDAETDKTSMALKTIQSLKQSNTNAISDGKTTTYGNSTTEGNANSAQINTKQGPASNQDYLNNLALATHNTNKTYTTNQDRAGYNEALGESEGNSATTQDYTNTTDRNVTQISNRDLGIDLHITDKDTYELSPKSLQLSTPFARDSIETNVSAKNVSSEDKSLSRYLDQVMDNSDYNSISQQALGQTANGAKGNALDNSQDKSQASAVFNTQKTNVIEDSAAKNGYLPFRISSHFDKNNVVFDITISGNSYIYQHSLTIEGNSSLSFGMPELPASKMHEDMQGSAQVYFKHLTLSVPVNNCQSGDIMTLNYQGCDEHGICYPPQSYKISMPNAISQSADDSDLVSMINNSVHLINDSHEEGIAEILKNNLLLGLLVCFVLGIGLDLTPCVLPMLPIFSTMLIGARANKVKVKDDVEVEADKSEAELKRNSAQTFDEQQDSTPKPKSQAQDPSQAQEPASNKVVTDNASSAQNQDKAHQDKSLAPNQDLGKGQDNAQDQAHTQNHAPSQNKVNTSASKLDTGAKLDTGTKIGNESAKGHAVKKNRFKDHEFRVVLLQNIGYSTGLSFTYMVLGLLFASLGASLHNILQSPVVIICIALLLCGCALSCAGVIELSLPSFITNRVQAKINNLHTRSFPGAILFGMLSALIASPCTSAPLAGALLYIFTTGNMLVGALYFWAIGLGMAFPLFIIGVFGSKALLKSKILGDVVKRLLVVILLITAYLMVSHLLGAFDLILRTLLIYIVCVYVSTSMLALVLRHNLPMSKVMSIAFLCLLPSYLSYNYFEESGSSVHYEFFTQVHTNNEIKARSKDKYTFIIFTAEWCKNCKQMEEQVYSSDRFMLSSTDLNKLVVDITDTQDAATAEIIKKYKLVGVPCYIILDPAGTVIEQRLGLQSLDSVINSIHRLHYQQQYAL